MPRMPSVDDFQRATPTPQRSVTGIDTSATARALGQLGATMADAGDRLGREQDAQALFQARRQLDDWERAAIYDPKDGAINKLGKDAFGLREDVPKAYDEAAGKISASLSNARQRRAFDEMSTARRGQVLDWTERHVAREREVYDLGQYKADMQSVQDRAAQFANDPARVESEMAVGRARTIGFLRSKGRSEEEINAALRDQAEKTHVAVLDTLLSGDNWKAAKQYLDKNAEQMNPAAVLRLSNQVQKQQDTVEGVAAAHGVIGTMQPQMQPNDMDRVVNITMASESGGRRYGKDGQLLTSAAGAKGEMQVLDSTNGNPGFGVKPAKDNSPDERARVGRDYLTAMVKRYGGDMQKAWAAYNAGPDRVDQALAAAKDKAGTDWTTLMPQETQAYVAKNMKALESGGGAPSRPTLQEVHATLRESLKGKRPEQVKVALEEASRLYKEQTDAIKQRDDEAVANAQRGLLSNGGSWSGLPPQVRNAVPPGKVDELLNYGARVAKGDDTTDPIVFQKMATDDKWLKGMTDAEFFWQSRKLSQSDAQQMALRRGTLLNPKGASNQPGDLDFASFNSALNNRLNQMGIDPTPPQRDTAGQQRVGAIRQSLTTYLLAQQQQAGKKFNDAEMTKAIDSAFARQIPFRSIGFFGGETVAPERLLTMKATDIPASVTEKLKADFKAAGVSNPTEGDLLGAYFNLKLR